MKFSRLLVGSILIASTVCHANTTKETAWVSATDNSCKQYSGVVSQHTCAATWQNAQEICKVNGATLASVEEIKKAIIDCGGKITDSAMSEEAKANMKNTKYQECIKAKGFAHFSWTGTTNQQNTNYALYANFEVGGIFNYNKNNKQTFHCMRESEH